MEISGIATEPEFGTAHGDWLRTDGFRIDGQVLAAAGIRELQEAQISCAVFDGETRLVESSVITVTF